MRLALGTHNRGQRRIARVVDCVGDRDDTRQLGLDGVVARLDLALDRHAAIGQRDRGGLRNARHLEQLGDQTSHHVALAVGSLLSEQDQVERFALQCGGQYACGPQQVAASSGLVGDVDRTIATLGKRAINRSTSALRCHRHDRDLGVGRRPFLDLNRCLNGMTVVRIQRVLAATHKPVRAIINPLHRGGVWYFLHADRDSHGPAS